ncbi:phosphatase inhibitor protein [Spatholobus suberectus]|nr:phosphatase inhibitor protein [Spatholobus suberectus]
MEKKVLDLILVPSGLLVMLAYHFWLLHQIMKHPTKTVIGVNAINRRFWVQAMMEDVSKNGVLAVQSLRNNIMASTLLASTAIMLSSLIAVLMSSGNERKTVVSEVYGDRSELGLSIKFFSILVCFLLAFLLNVQSIRYYSHASILINVPFKKVSTNLRHQMLTAEYVATTVNRGSYFWSLGLRAFYFSFPLFMWLFGPIPVFFSSFALVFMLYFLDVTFECSWAGVADTEGVEVELHKHNVDVEIGRAN